MHPLKLHSPAKRQAYKTGIFALLMILLILASAIPFFWESKSLWYKIGFDKTLLRAGKIAGICAAILLLFQIILALKIKFLDRIFGLDRLYYLHKCSAIAIVVLAMLHGSLVIIPEGVENLPIGWKFWPEMLGGVILSLLLFFVGTALFRRKIMPYHLWRSLHRPMGYLFAVALSVHIFNVSDSFAQSVPKYSLWTLIGVISLIVLVAKIREYFDSRRILSVENCTALNDDIISLSIPAPPSFSHAPGQFAFLELYGKNIPPEAHPFTIASAPNGGDKEHPTLQFYIKRCGDWTETITPEEVRRASIRGPYGLFSYKAKPPADLIVFIAGGIGITPLLSMLRQLSNEDISPPAMLIWSVSRKKDMFLKDELESLQNLLAHLRFHFCYSQEQGGRRLDQEQLGQLLESVPRKTHFYICGPEMMMVHTRKNLFDLGFSSKNIFWERFAL